ncbi:MAG: dynein regulation protein LC7 [Candidatus Aegiribacteria sp.]|nr:dynein regulation protein LC7 [Candidatus Aegiribacteria sp.]
MENIQDILKDLTGVSGISAAVCVGRDGFVIESSTKSDVDAEILGAVVSAGMGSSESIGKELKVGDMAQAMLEYDSGIILMAGIGPDAILSVLAAKDSSLGNIRLQLKKSVPRLSATL